MPTKANTYKVLVIEDDPALMFGLRENLEMEGYAVLTSIDGELGLELARKERPDLIVLDIMLPGLNGFQICQELREDEFDMPIIRTPDLPLKEHCKNRAAGNWEQY
jgi:two-component system response regulator VicR